MSFHEMFIEKCPLFKGITREQLGPLLQCLHHSIKVYEAGEYVFRTGDLIGYIGIVIDGRLALSKETPSGNHTIIAILTASQLFGEGIVCTSKRVSPVSVYADQRTTIMLIPYDRIIKSCGNACTFHTQLIHNMLLILGDKNFTLNHKIELLMLKGIQEKLITYLLQEAKKRNTTSFEIPFNRTELAAFLNVSRTSMCRELAVLKEAQLLDYYQNSFKLLDLNALRHKLL